MFKNVSTRKYLFFLTGWLLTRRLNLRRDLRLLRSTRFHQPFFFSCSSLRSQLIWRTLPSSTSILTSSSFKPGTSSAVKTWASASPSIDAHTGECCSLGVGGDAREDAAAAWIGSQKSRGKGSKVLARGSATFSLNHFVFFTT